MKDPPVMTFLAVIMRTNNVKSVGDLPPWGCLRTKTWLQFDLRFDLLMIISRNSSAS